MKHPSERMNMSPLKHCLQNHACHGQNVIFSCQQRSTDAKNSGASSTAAAHGATTAMPSKGNTSSRLRAAALCLQRRGRLTAADTLRAPQRRHGVRILQRTEPFQSILPDIAWTEPKRHGLHILQRTKPCQNMLPDIAWAWTEPKQ